MTQDLFDLSGKIALVTGASRGIGAAASRLLAARHATVLLSSRKTDGLEAVAEEIRQAGGSAHVMACHMGKLHEIETLMQTISSRFGRLDILVANAATNPHFDELRTAGESVWDKIFDVNLKGPFFLIQAASRLMEETGGSIIAVSSINGISPALFQGVYSISKAGVISMVKAYARELASRKIRVNALLPGLTDTKFASPLTKDPDILRYATERIPMGRIATPEEMAGAILYLASDAASFTTGSCITCDGGQTA